ncbi:hypothetical protein NL676_018920 [Syzygium grande]|nr:hypothetical protein NL676_018920 [Syzygium grande]
MTSSPRPSDPSASFCLLSVPPSKDSRIQVYQSLHLVILRIRANSARKRRNFEGIIVAMSTKSELMFIPSPDLGHQVSTVEIAKLVDRDDRLSITILIMKLPFDSEADSCIELLAASIAAGVHFVILPRRNPSPDTCPVAFLNHFIESHNADVREAVADLHACGSPQLAGLIVDMFCTTLIEVTSELGIPSYVFFTSGAAGLGLMMHLQSLQDEHHMDLTGLEGSDAELDFLCFRNPLPAAKLLPSEIFMKEALAVLGAPAVYPVGPIVNFKVESAKGPEGDNSTQGFEILEWFEQQPDASVVFLCFGSFGSFDEDQAKEIARALERSGRYFLWSLRQPPAKGKLEAPRDYADPAEVLPEGFLDRTAGVGRVIGWAPQVAILGHPAIGGFVSHCRWNSILESIWFGVPVVAWPQYAEQQLNAFELVVELSVTSEIKMDYRRDFAKGSNAMTADEIEEGIRKLMEAEEAEERRKKVKEASEE